MPLNKEEREVLEKLYSSYKDKIFTFRLIDRDKAIALFEELCSDGRLLDKNEIIIVLKSLDTIDV